MSGGITQLVAVGAQDEYLVGKPEVSFFKATYKRHTNFSHVAFRQVIQGNPAPGGISTIRFERKGDLLGYCFLTMKDGSTNEVLAFDPDSIDYIELMIGGHVVDKQYYDFMVHIADPLLVTSQNKAAHTHDKICPLHFWFCESWASALPLVSMQFHDVEMRITWKNPDTTKIYECWSDYVFLDRVEREDLAGKKSQQVLMYQVQTQMASMASTQPLVFNQPVKFLACSVPIVANPDTALIRLQLNGTDIGEEKNYDPHFTDAPFYYHCPNSSTTWNGGKFLHPFCLDTTKVQPSGSLNFSRLDSARFVSTNDTFSFSGYIYAVNYNILNIENGMAGLLYAN